MGPLDNRVLAPDALQSRPGGYSVSIRTPWYRSLPLSSIDHLRVCIDGLEGLGTVTKLTVGGRDYHPEDVAGRYDQWWFMLDDLIATVTTTARLVPEAQYTVRVELGLRVPYLLVGPDRAPLVTAGKYAATLRCA